MAAMGLTTPLRTAVTRLQKEEVQKSPRGRSLVISTPMVHSVINDDEAERARRRSSVVFQKRVSHIGVSSDSGAANDSRNISDASLQDNYQTVNAIGCLLELCSEKNIPQPDFVLTGDVGPPHSRNFTMEFRIAGMVVSATDTTKKRAKQLAAQKMLHRLQDTLLEDLQDMQAINTPALTDEETSILGKKKVNWGQKISPYQRSVKNIMQEKNISYSELWKDADECNSDSVQDVINKLELNYTLHISENEGNWICFASLNTEPEFLNADIDTSKDVAVSKSIMKTYTFFKIMSE